ncbi:MAG: hypothetical protein ACOVKV_05585, partial [Novosphingobium sp.]
KLNERFRSEDKVDQVELEMKDQQFLYENDGRLVFMDSETYEQIELDADLLGERPDRQTVVAMLPHVFATCIKEIATQVLAVVRLLGGHQISRATGQASKQKACLPNSKPDSGQTKSFATVRKGPRVPAFSTGWWRRLAKQSDQ